MCPLKKFRTVNRTRHSNPLDLWMCSFHDFIEDLFPTVFCCSSCLCFIDTQRTFWLLIPLYSTVCIRFAWSRMSYRQPTASVHRTLLIVILFVLSSVNGTNGNNDENDFKYIKKYAADLVNDDVLNVHIVPHTHDDVGWLKTVEQYYYGLNETIQIASVHDIIDTVFECLSENSNRTFTYVEQKFFSMWWNIQNDTIKDAVRFLVSGTKQFNFVNGGWCMHDEATTHYVGMIDQTTLGHAFLKNELGVIPRVGWQLDPFGHSSTQASLLSSKVGFDSLYFGRIDYQDLDLRREQQECEGLWNASSSLSDTTLFWGLTGSYGGNYGAPDGFCFDPYCNDPDASLVDKDEGQLLERMKLFLNDIQQQSNETKGNHIMLTMGSDFQYRQAYINFQNLDILIETLMNVQATNQIDIEQMLGPKFKHVNIFYSSPEYYTDCKYQEFIVKSTTAGATAADTTDASSLDTIDTAAANIESSSSSSTRTSAKAATKQRSLSDDEDNTLTVKTDDFFPYSDCHHCFWTGYFTSRAGFKRVERLSSSILMAARQIDSMTDGLSTDHDKEKASSSSSSSSSTSSCPCSCQTALHVLADASGVAQHHDGVSGTAKQHVANDYTKRLQSGIHAVVDACMVPAIKRQFLGDNSKNYLQDFSFCQFLNETKCSISQEATKTNDRDVYVVVYNSLAMSRSTIVHLPVSTEGIYQVTNPFLSSVKHRRLKSSDSSTFNHAYDQNNNNDYKDKKNLVWSHPSTDDFSMLHHVVQDAAKYVLPIETGLLPPLGASLFKVSLVNSTTELSSSLQSTSSMEKNSLRHRTVKTTIRNVDHSNKKKDFVASNEFYSVVFDGSTGQVKQMTTLDNTTVALRPSVGYYTSYDSRFDRKDKNDDTSTGVQNSGAYIFRPSTPDQQLIEIGQVSATIVNTSAGVEVHATFEEKWVKTITRVLTGQPFLEVEYTVGPIPIHDQRGREAVVRYGTDNNIKSSGIFYTDSNGREFIKRKRDFRPTWDLSVEEPVAGNYYPVNAAIYIEDENEEEDGVAMAVATDRSQAGGSIIDGSVELMVHRRTMVDDSRGVGEPMNETDGGITPYPPYGNATRLGAGIVIRGKHRILIGKSEKQNGSIGGGARLARSVMDGIFAEPLVFVGSSPSSAAAATVAVMDGGDDATDIPFLTSNFTSMKKNDDGSPQELPPNVMLLTRSLLHPYGMSPRPPPLSSTSSFPETSTVRHFLIRVAHQYGLAEADCENNLSKSAVVDFSIFFPNQEITSVLETTLSANQSYDNWLNKKLDWTGITTPALQKQPEQQHQNQPDSFASIVDNEKNYHWVEATTILLEPMDIRTFIVTVK